MIEKKRILITRDYPDIGIEMLRRHPRFALTLWDHDRPMTHEELTRRAKDHDAVWCTVSDLTDALIHGEIWGAGLDVTDPEPMDRDHPLLTLPNVCVLPHIGSATIEARNRMSEMAAENIIRFYETGRIPHQVPG